MTAALDNALSYFFQKYPDILAQDKLAIGVSGGPDSMALAAALIDYCTNAQKEFYILSVNHGLRDEAADEIKMIEEWAHDKNLTHKILRWEGEKPENGVMAAARQARYDLMAGFCAAQNISTLFIAHHADDQAETFLIRLAKGSGLDGLAAMNDLRLMDSGINIARPFLDVPKQDLLKYCQEQGIPFVHDPSNDNKKYMRPRLRQSMEILAAEGLSAKRLTATAKRLSRARLALEDMTTKAYAASIITRSTDKVTFDYDDWVKNPEEIALRVILNGISALRPQAIYQVRMEKLEALFESLWHDPASFKPRTLGGLKFSLRAKNTEGLRLLEIEKEAVKT